MVWPLQSFYPFRTIDESMHTPEYPSASEREQLQFALLHIQHQLEINDENENPLERSANRDCLLEQQDVLLEFLSSFDSPKHSLPTSNSTT